MTENDIMHDTESFWVSRERWHYTVWRVTPTHSVSDSAYLRTPEGLALAIARADYLSETHINRKA